MMRLPQYRPWFLACIVLAAVPIAARAMGPTTAPTVGQLIDQLSAPDPDARDKAASDLESLPQADLPQLEAAFTSHDLPPAAGEALGRLLPRARQRAKIADRKVPGRAALAAFYESEALSSYDHSGHTNPKWDSAARAFLQASAREHGLAGPALDAQRPRTIGLMRAILALRCNDPTVLACAGLLTGDTKGSARTVAQLFDRASQELPTAEGISPLYRLIIDGRVLRSFAALSATARKQQRADIEQQAADLPMQYQRLLGIAGVPPVVVLEFAGLAVDRTGPLHVPLKPILDGVIDPMMARLPNDPAALEIRGRAFVQYAWQARGAGYANTVTPQGEADFEARLGQAKEMLSQAYQQDPDVPEACDDMLTVARGLGFDRPTMEMWYRRAIAANPDDYNAADRRLTFLEPKWMGDPDAMLQFGRECVADGNFRSEIPLILVEAHTRLAEHYARDATYWLTPGVWDDVRSVYEGYIKRDRSTITYRNLLARAAIRCHQWKVADEQFKLLGDLANPGLYDNSVEAFTAARQKAAELADKPDAQGK